MTKGHYLAVTAQEGDSDDREKHRKTKNNNTVHPQILQNNLQVPVSENDQVAVTMTISPRLPTAQRRDATPFASIASFNPKRSLLSKSTGCKGCNDHKE